MENLSALLSSGNRQIYLERSGLATRCRLACAAVAAGRSAVLVAATGKNTPPRAAC